MNFCGPAIFPPKDNHSVDPEDREISIVWQNDIGRVDLIIDMPTGPEADYTIYKTYVNDYSKSRYYVYSWFPLEELKEALLEFGFNE